jgi:chitodextrinase
VRRRLAFPLAVFATALCGAPAHAATVRHSDDFKRDRTVTEIVRGKSVVRVDPAKSPSLNLRRPRATAGRLGSYRVALLLVNFTSDTRQPWTPSHVNDRFFGASDSTAAYYAEQSYGQVGVSGDVYGWLTVDQPTAGCNIDAWASAARSAASAQGVALGGYDSVAFVFPRQSSCGWAGLAELPGDQFWLNGDVSTRVAAHELGHNMGVHHAGSLTCTANGAFVAVSPDCSFDEYGDPFDVMGSRARRMGGWHLQQLGYLGASAVQTVTADGTYTLRSTLGSDTQVLRIPRQPQKNPREYYYLDLRSAGGAFDTFGSTDPAVTGVTLRVGNDPNVIRQSQLIDTTPGSSRGFQDAPLAAGRVFSDGNVSVTVQSIGAGAATVSVTFGGAPPDIEPPSRPGDAVITNDGRAFDLTWAASTDNRGVAGYRVLRDSDVIGTTDATHFRDEGVVARQGYTYTVEAFDAAGNTTQGARSAAVALTDPATLAPPADTIPTGGDEETFEDTDAPRVRFRSPGSGAKLRRSRRTVVKATAVDGYGWVERLELWVDGKRRVVSRREKIDWAWALKKVKPGKHRLALVAIDDSGNKARKSMTVRVVR